MIIKHADSGVFIGSQFVRNEDCDRVLVAMLEHAPEVPGLEYCDTCHNFHGAVACEVYCEWMLNVKASGERFPDNHVEVTEECVIAHLYHDDPGVVAIMTPSGEAQIGFVELPLLIAKLTEMVEYPLRS